MPLSKLDLIPKMQTLMQNSKTFRDRELAVRYHKQNHTQSRQQRQLDNISNYFK